MVGFGSAVVPLCAGDDPASFLFKVGTAGGTGIEKLDCQADRRGVKL